MACLLFDFFLLANREKASEVRNAEHPRGSALRIVETIVHASDAVFELLPGFLAKAAGGVVRGALHAAVGKRIEDLRADQKRLLERVTDEHTAVASIVQSLYIALHELEKDFPGSNLLLQ